MERKGNDITGEKDTQARLLLQADILANTSDVIYSTDMELRLTSWNRAAEETYGLKANDVLGKNVLDVTGSKFNPDMRKKLSARLMEKGPITAEVEHVTKSGRKIIFDSETLLLRDSEGKPEGLVAINRDITELKKADERVRESEARFKAISENSPVGIGVVSVPEGEYLYVNPAYEKSFGYSKDELLGRKSRDIYFDPAQRNRMLQLLKERGSVTDFEVLLKRKDGTPLWSVSSITPIIYGDKSALLGAFIDITERKMAQESVRTELQRFYAILSDMNSALLLVTDEGRVEFANQTLCDQFELKDNPKDLKGISSSEMIEKIRAAYLHPDEQVARIKEILARGKTVKGEEVQMRGNRTCLRDYVPISFGGKSYGRLWQHIDITDRKSAEEALKESDKKYRDLFMNMTEEVHFWKLIRDEKGNIKTWAVVDVNPPALKSWGRKSLEDTVGRTADEIYQDATAHFMPIVQKIMTEGMPYSYENYFPPPADKHFRFTSVPMGEYFITTGADITDIRKTEATIRESEERLKLAQASAGAGMWDWDIPSGKLKWSDELFRLFGLDPGKTEATFEVWERVMHPEDKKGASERINTAIKDQTQLQSEYRIILPSGEVKWINALGNTTYDNKGKPQRMSGICIDITERRRAEEALRQSEERFRLALKNSPVSVAAQDRNLRFIWAYNQRTINPAEVLGKGDSDIFAPEDAKLLMTLKRKVIESGKQMSKQLWLRSNGKKVFVHLYLEPLRSEAGEITGVGIATVDLTEQKNAEDELFEANERYIGLLNNPLVGVYRSNLKGEYIYVNDTFVKMLGFDSESELVSKGTLAKYPNPEDRDMFINDLKRDGRLVDYEKSYVRKNGEPIDIICDIVLRGEEITGMCKDITELKKAKEALNASEIRYRRLFEAAKDGILILDAGSGKVVEVNLFLITLLGYPRDEFLGKELWQIGLFKDIAASKGSFLELQNRGYVCYEDLQLETKDGARIDVEFVSNVYLIEGNKVIQCNIRDITERKKAKDLIRLKVKELNESNEELSRFNKAMVDRELRMGEMKREVNELLEKLGLPKRYNTDEVEK